MENVEIKFGTDGFRGIIAKDFTFDTLERIINAISLYLRNSNGDKNTVIIGYDPRFIADKFAHFSSELFCNSGFKVILSSKVVPTPIVAYCAKYYPDSSGAIMISASHNPKEYQGIKFIPSYGGPATKEITDEILKYLDKKIQPREGGEIVIQDLEKEYFSHIEKIINFEIIRKNQPKIIYDGLFSASIGYFDKLLEKNSISYEGYNLYYSSDFGNGLPEPKAAFMKYKKEGYITFANDGDSDRYGVIDEKGEYVSPNLILALLLKYLVQKNKKGAMIKTIGVSGIIDVLCKKLNVKAITTPVGFKWLSEAMRTTDTILAGEESGGLSSGWHIPEKDGIYANLLILEMVSALNKPLFKMVDEIKEFIGCEFFNDRVDIKLINKEEGEKIILKFSNLDKFENLKIIDKSKLDGLKLFFDKNHTSLLIRNSGTEPLLRFYIESDNKICLDNIKSYLLRHAHFF